MIDATTPLSAAPAAQARRRNRLPAATRPARKSAKRRKLDVECVFSEDADGRGHRVSTDPKTLAAAYAFFAKHLKD